MSSNEHTNHQISYGTYFIVWLTLIGLTVLTVAIAGVNFGSIALFLAMTVAAIKSTFVISYFMHIKFDDKIFLVFLILALASLLVIFVLTIFDVFYR
jgi:cytochrome c oxidase subunit 4